MFRDYGTKMFYKLAVLPGTQTAMSKHQRDTNTLII